MRKSACARTCPKKVAEVLAAGGTIQQPWSDTCSACKMRWDVTHMLVIYDTPDESITSPENAETRERRQLSILVLELAEEFFLRAHSWHKREDGSFQPPVNYRFRKDPDKHYDRSHAVNSQKQVYNSLYSHEKQWEGEVAHGRVIKRAL